MSTLNIYQFYAWAKKYEDARYFARPFNHISMDTEIYIWDRKYDDHNPVVICQLEVAKTVLSALNKGYKKGN